MKKFIACLALAFAVAFAAKAQIGILAGLTSSQTNVKSAYAEASHINQYHVGLAYKISLGGVLAIQPALIYNVKGSELDVVMATPPSGMYSSREDFDVDFKTGFLELPVQIQAGIPLFGVARVYGLAEPFIGYAITNSWKAEYAEVRKGWDNVKNRFEYGVGLGAGVELFDMLQVSLKYFWNLGNLYGSTGESKIPTSIDSIVGKVNEGTCNGLALSAYIFF